MPLPPLPHGLTARPLTSADAPAAFDVFAADELADSGRRSLEPEDVEADWARPSFDLATDSVGVFDGDRLVGAAEVSRAGTWAEGAVHPDRRGRGVGSWLVAWIEDRAGRDSDFTAQAVPKGSAADRLLAALGFEHSYDAWILDLPNDVTIPERTLPDGYRFTTPTAEEDVRAAHQVIEDGFMEWGHGRIRQSFEDWASTTVRRPGGGKHRLRSVVDAAGATVASAFALIDGDGCGQVHQLATRADQRGRGLAQALLADGFGWARAEGATSCDLSTDSRSSARSLYEKVGMVVSHTWVCRRKQLR